MVSQGCSRTGAGGRGWGQGLLLPAEACAGLPSTDFTLPWRKHVQIGAGGWGQAGGACPSHLGMA